MSIKIIKRITESEVIDLALNYNLTPDNYFSGWDILGDWQLNCLIEFGMKPSHKLLDIGSGAMRLGLKAVDYLDSGSYCGIDPYQPYVQLGNEVMKKIGLGKSFQTISRDDFSFSQFKTKFDFAMAQSVLTHLSLEQTENCLKSLKPCMNVGGKFVFTYTVGSYPTRGLLYGTHPMERPWMDNLEELKQIGARHGARLETTSMAHPTGQSVAIFHY